MSDIDLFECDTTPALQAPRKRARKVRTPEAQAYSRYDAETKRARARELAANKAYRESPAFRHAERVSAIQGAIVLVAFGLLFLLIIWSGSFPSLFSDLGNGMH